MTDARIAFVGAGNMATALAGGLLRSGRRARDLIAADPAPQQRERMAALGVATTADNAIAVRAADVVVLAVKPQVLGEVVRGLAPALERGQLLLSIAAGVPLAALRAWCGAIGSDIAIVRCMPNTPALYGAGITAYFANDMVGARHVDLTESILQAAGDFVRVDSEDELDAVTALSGSGPAYFFYLMEAMTAAGVRLGLGETLAQRLTLATAHGAAVMARETGESPAQLRRNVTSPGGTTERAVGVLDSKGLREGIETAVRAAAERSRELAAEFGA